MNTQSVMPGTDYESAVARMDEDTQKLCSTLQHIEDSISNVHSFASQHPLGEKQQNTLDVWQECSKRIRCHLREKTTLNPPPSSSRAVISNQAYSVVGNQMYDFVLKYIPSEQTRSNTPTELLSKAIDICIANSKQNIQGMQTSQLPENTQPSSGSGGGQERLDSPESTKIDEAEEEADLISAQQPSDRSVEG
ncbi:hypothetical protein M231_04982 [Tremella mesenterica]|uniref:Uncharacterized protein n=1 Tax=Tremella mesenterica TaxID=5217 RepID=A0A4Q1BJ58_TREME|nr:hypothetical protein M231_04982 [Tremella mesenterica]